MSGAHNADFLLQIELQVSEGQLRLRVENSIGAPVPGRPPGQGVGLPNVRRLELLYPQSHALHLTQTATRYRADLELTL